MDVMHMPPLQSNWMAFDVLHEEIINNLGGAPKAAKVVETTACSSMPPLSSVGGQAGKIGTGDGTTKSLCTSHIPVSVSMASFMKITIQFIFLQLWFWLQVWECVSNQYFRLIRIIMIRIPCWVSCQLLSMFRQ